MEDISFYSPINDSYKKFFEKFTEINTLKISDYKPTHVLSYFCNQYYKYYNTHYKFKYNVSQPSKCFEVFQVKRLGEMLSKDPNILIHYINWLFKNKIPNAKRKITSISFINNEFFLKEYKMQTLYSQEVTLTRTTKLPESYYEIFKETDYPCATYGDLSFLYLSKEKDNYLDYFEKLEKLGFDLNLLKKVL